ncbi:MAG: hypothetical protein E2O68_08495, partial [Deltaproteobacteria bacterium]
MNSFKYLLFPIVLLTLFSCGMIKTKKDFISIDSKPRGLVVYRQQEGKVAINKIGTTPMFLEVSKRSEDVYMMQDPVFTKRSVNTTPKKICRYLREGEQFYPGQDKKDASIVKKFVNNWTPENLLKGSSYECITTVRASLKKTKTPKKIKTCHTYLIMPPSSSYLKVSRDLSKAWVEQIFNKQKKKCDKVITPAVSEGHMLFLGIS